MLAPTAEFGTPFRFKKKGRCFSDSVNLFLKCLFKTGQVNHGMKVPIFFHCLYRKPIMTRSDI